MKQLSELYKLWDSFNTPIDENECIEISFLHFGKGTSRYDIWHWFESQNPKFLCGEVMAGVKHED